jgi:hypothetical protein
MTAVDPEGRIRHPLDVFHSTYAPDGSFIPSGYVPVADGAGLVDYLDSAGFGDTTALDAAVFGYQAHGNLGSTETFDSTAAGWHSGTLNADCTFTFTAPASGTVGSMVLELTQDGTGGWALTMPGSVVGDFTGYDSTAGTTSLLMFFTRDGGTTWFGFIAGGSGSSVTALDDLTDVTITAPAEDDQLQYISGEWVNNSRRWEPVTTNPGAGPEIVFDGDDIVMTWRTY